MQITKSTEPKRALLVSIRTPKVTDVEAAESLAELARLVTTLGYKVIGTQSQRKASTGAANVVGAGKLEELVKLTGGRGSTDQFDSTDDIDIKAEVEEINFTDTPTVLADAVVFDCDLTPSQLRNVENALGVPILDRTGVIIEIFSRHARTRAARLQIEVARLKYLSPRLRELGGDKERQAGRGAGESTLELDRRNVRDRLAEIRRELTSLHEEQGHRRAQRSQQFRVALVGYTNAGKSSTMRALTGSDVLVEDKLFATLDTTVRAMQPETHPRILVSDTVGFIKKLPHDLVASFRSTLDEAHEASLLLYLVDASDPGFRSQLAVVNEVLQEVGVDDIPDLLVLNKSDQLNEEQKQSLLHEFPDAIMISTRNPDDIKALHKRIVKFSEHDMVEEEILVPYTAKGIIGEIHSSMRVVKETYEEEGVRVLVRAREYDLERVKKML